MLKTLPRLFVVLAIALAVPVQGVAAVSAGVCMDLGHGAGTTPEHDHGTSGHAHDSDAAAHHEDGAGNDGASHNAHCPPCVSCCAAAAIASFPAVFLPEQAAASVPAALPASFSGVLPERLDRPPLAL